MSFYYEPINPYYRLFKDGDGNWSIHNLQNGRRLETGEDLLHELLTLKQLIELLEKDNEDYYELKKKMEQIHSLSLQ